MVSIGVIDANTIYCLGISALIQRVGFPYPVAWNSVAAAKQGLQRDFPDVLIVSDSLIKDLEPKLPENSRASWALIVTLHAGNSAYLHHGGTLRPDGLILRSASEARFRDCLETVIAGHAWLDRTLYDSNSAGRPGDWRCLSTRELEIARLASEGLSNKQIARSLMLSDGTVKIHLHHVFAKLHLKKRAQLALHL